MCVFQARDFPVTSLEDWRASMLTIQFSELRPDEDVPHTGRLPR